MHILVKKRTELITSYNINLQKAISIGRHKLNDICLPDPALKISRFHAAIFCDTDGNYFLQDLGSQNNTYLNGKKCDYGKLNDKDSIEIGDYVLVFQEETSVDTVKKNNIALTDKNKSNSMKTIFSPPSVELQAIEEYKDEPVKLSLLYKLTHITNLNLNFEVSLQLIVEELHRTFNTDRIFIASFENAQDNIICLAQAPRENTDLKISRTILKYFFDNKKVMIIEDAVSDEKFKIDWKTAKSILEVKIKSVVCIPLKWDNEIKGLLYMDSLKEKGLFTEKDLSLFSLIGDDISSFMSRVKSYESLRNEKLNLEKRLELETAVIGISSRMREIMNDILRIINMDVTVLITGETGTGKGQLAKAVHQNSIRKDKPFIMINCSAIPENLLESEMFGHEKGSFTGALEKKTGKFRLANEGTLFLDEIGDLSKEHQAKLLNALEEKIIWPLGGKEPIPLDIRIIAATNCNLEQAVKEGKFRHDLYARLNVFRFNMPPLRDRKDDIPLLAGYFLFKERPNFGKRISRLSNKSIDLLSQYEWPDNIRELQTVIKRAIVYSEDSVITPDAIQLNSSLLENLKSLVDIEKEYIIRVLEHTRGNKEKAAKILCISKQTLYNKGKEHRISGFEGLGV